MQKIAEFKVSQAQNINRTIIAELNFGIKRELFKNIFFETQTGLKTSFS